jgi:hypothetical protein
MVDVIDDNKDVTCIHLGGQINQSSFSCRSVLDSASPQLLPGFVDQRIKVVICRAHVDLPASPALRKGRCKGRFADSCATNNDCDQEVRQPFLEVSKLAFARSGGVTAFGSPMSSRPRRRVIRRRGVVAVAGPFRPSGALAAAAQPAAAVSSAAAASTTGYGSAAAGGATYLLRRQTACLRHAFRQLQGAVHAEMSGV